MGAHSIASENIKLGKFISLLINKGYVMSSIDTIFSIL